MRIRLLKNVRMAGASSVELLAGSVANVTPEVADKWIKQGIAMEDKAIEPQEAKITPRPKPKTIAPAPLRNKAKKG